MSSTKRTKRKDKRSGESSTVSGTGGSHLSSDSESPPGKKTHRKSGRLMKKKLGKYHPREQEYDGDKENSSENSCPSSATPPHNDEYDFDEVDVIPLVDKSGKKQKGAKKSKVLQKKVTEKIVSKPSKLTTKNPELKKSRILSSTPIYTDINVTTDIKKQPVSRLKRKVIDTSGDCNQKKRLKKMSITPILGTPMTDSSSSQSFPSIRRSKRKMVDSINITPAIRKGNNKTVFETESDKGDSGMFVSPPPRKLLRLAAKDTSTPSDVLTSTSTKMPKLGFDETVSLLISPVENVSNPSPTSDYGSIVSSMSQFSLVEGHIPKPLFELEDEEPELKLNKSMSKGYVKGSRVKIKKVTKGRYSVSKLEAWADKVNEDFDEIEKFELSIEG